MKRAKQVLALLLSLALLLGLCGLAEEPVEAEIAEAPVEEIAEEPVAEEAIEEPAEEEAIEEPAEEEPIEELAEEEPVEEPVAEEPVEAPEAESVEEIPAEGEESVEMEQIDAEDLGAYRWTGTYMEGLQVTELVIPEGYTSVADCGCDTLANMVSVQFPSTLKYIGIEAFRDCTSLLSVDIPASVTQIGKSAFYHCTSLRSVSLPDGLSSLGNVFEGCTSLSEVNIPSSATNLYCTFTDCEALTSVELPKNIENLDQAFTGCKSLTSIVLPESVKSMNSTFKGCTALEHVTWEGITANSANIAGAFEDCSSLKEFVFPNGFKGSIVGAFKNCTSLKEISIPKGANVSGFAFQGCTALETVTYPEKMDPSTSFLAGFSSWWLTSDFDSCTGLKNVYLPENCAPDEYTSSGVTKYPFCDSPDVTLHVFKGSSAETFCKEHKINYVYRTGNENATVSIPDDSIILSQKETKTIKPKTEGLKKKESYTFSTSDANIASVSKSGGKITAKNPGQATITAKGKTSGASATCTITVIEASASLTITETPAQINLEEEFQLAATIAPAEALQEFTWTSSKPKIASVDKTTGLVKALKEGKTTITATAKHKNLKGKSVTAKFPLTVVDPTRPTAIKIDPEMQTELVMEGGQQVTMQLKYALEPAETAETEVTWSIPKKAHKSYASVTKEGQLTAKKAGKVQVKVTAKKKSAAGKTLSDTFEITIVDPTIPTSVTITEADGTQIKKGEKLTLHATCAPETAENAELVWSSSNTKIAKVNKTTGEITAVKPGKAKITAKAKKGGQKASITIQVIKP